MRQRVTAVGVLLLIVALYLYFNPSTVVPLSSSLGSVGTDTVYSRNSAIMIAPESFSNYTSELLNGDSVTVSLTANPGNIDVLLMNQGNFSLWLSGAKGSYSTYPESHLQVSNYSFTFTNNEKTQNFSLVLLSHSTSRTEVLLRAVATRPSEEALLLFPVLFGFLGVVLVAVGLRGGGGKAAAKSEAEEPARARPSQAQAEVARCRHCGAPLEAGSGFCPSCNRSQF